MNDVGSKTRIPPRMVDYDIIGFTGEQAPLNSLKQYLNGRGKELLHSLDFNESLKLAKWWRKQEARIVHRCNCTCYKCSV